MVLGKRIRLGKIYEITGTGLIPRGTGTGSMCNKYQDNQFESYTDYIMTSQDEFNHQPYSG